MPSTIDAATALELEQKPKLTEAEKKEFLEQAIERREKLAESRLDMAKMFIQSGKMNIAQRRLRELVDEFGESAAAGEAREFLGKA